MVAGHHGSAGSTLGVPPYELEFASAAKLLPRELLAGAVCARSMLLAWLLNELNILVPAGGGGGSGSGCGSAVSTSDPSGGVPGAETGADFSPSATSHLWADGMMAPC